MAGSFLLRQTLFRRIHRPSKVTFFGNVEPALYFRCAKMSHTARIREHATTEGQATGPSHKWELNPSRSNKNQQSREAMEKLRQQDFGPLNETDKEVEAKLKEIPCSPTDVLCQSIRDGTASAHVVHLCLAAQYRKIRLSSRDERDSESEGIASIVLRHIWTNENIWGPIVMHARQTQYFLCYFAISEGLEDYILKWTMIALPGQSTSSDAGRNVWRGALLRNLISAKFSQDPNNEADSALQCFFAALGKKKAASIAHARGQQVDFSIICLSLLPAYVEIQKNITGGGFVFADRSLFDRFLHYQRSYPVLSRSEKEFDTARLLLYHPQKASETSAIEILRRHKQLGNVIPKAVLSPQGSVNFKRFLQRTVDVAEANCNFEDVAWVLKYYKDRVNPATSRFWSKRATIYRHLTQGPQSDVSSARQHPVSRVQKVVSAPNSGSGSPSANMSTSQERNGIESCL